MDRRSDIPRTGTPYCAMSHRQLLSSSSVNTGGTFGAGKFGEMGVVWYVVIRDAHALGTVVCQ